MFEERLRIVEDSACEVPDLVAPEVGLVVEVVALLALEAAEEIGVSVSSSPSSATCAESSGETVRGSSFDLLPTTCTASASMRVSSVYNMFGIV